MATTVQDIIDAVRWCYDEESLNASDLSDVAAAENDNTLMDNIIKAKIGDALRWIGLYAPADQLTGAAAGSGTSVDIIREDTLQASNNTLSPTKTLVRVIRVRGTGWHRAILGDSLIKEDSDEYLQLMDTNGATATVDRPQAALVNTKERKVEVWPGAGSFVLTYIKVLDATDIGNLNDPATPVGVPDLLWTSFIYYIAFLVLSAYEDTRAPRMLEIAKMNLGLTDDKQRA